MLHDFYDTVLKFITQISYEAIPPATSRQAKLSILDCCGTMLGGSREEAARIVQRYIDDLQSRPVATVVGTHFQASPALAALANGVAAHALCYDDTHLPSMTHTSAVVLPAVLAMAEHQGASGRDLLTAYIIGFEIVAKLGRSLNPGHYRKGWHATSTLGVFGAAAGAAYLLGLDETRIRMALSLAASSAAGVRSNIGFMSMFYHAGNASRLGLEAASLAAQGFSASPNAMGELGFYELYSDAGEFDLTPLTMLGKSFDLEEPGPVIKPFPCGALSHRAIQAALILRAKVEFDPDDIERVDCAVGYAHSRVLIHPVPTTILEAKISMQFPVAVALLEGKAGSAQLTATNLERPVIQNLMRKTHIVVHPALTKEQIGWLEDPYDTPASVIVHLRDGSTIQETVEREKGHPQEPYTYEEMWDKFYDSVSVIKSKTEAKELYELIDNLPSLTDLRALSHLLRSNISS